MNFLSTDSCKVRYLPDFFTLIPIKQWDLFFRIRIGFDLI